MGDSEVGMVGRTGREVGVCGLAEVVERERVSWVVGEVGYGPGGMVGAAGGDEATGLVGSREPAGDESVGSRDLFFCSRTGL